MSHAKARQKRGHTLYVSVFALLVCVQMAAPAWVWGRLGHRVISKLAEKKINPNAKAAIADLLDEVQSAKGLAKGLARN